ncbi:MAG: 3-deoxy-D-manno-octulosonic acid transferase [Bacteroidales bacterium]|jgi:3-deoxy-D-manno-octulosonic-acid transferase|nr:3-deoxy-D-manno-octulosonic acid transferase [Bacteroidales bacterium]
MAAIYQLFIHIYGFLTSVYALFNKKVRQMVRGRRQTWRILREKIQPTDKVIWVHCASLGEFEQGRVLIELLKKEYHTHKILLSFYSPSGYEIRKNYQYADCVVYLPNDTRRNAKRFIRLTNPQISIFIKYEFWYNYLALLNGRKVYQVSLILRENHYLFKRYSGWFRQKLGTFTHFFVQNEQTADLLLRHNFNNYTICGDTRFDRVKQIAENAVEIPLIEKWSKDEKILILGSSWREDEKILQQSNLVKQMKVLIVPHQIEETHISYIKNLFPQSLLYTELNEANISTTNLVIVNTIGLLSSLYRYCHYAYIGGGFGAGIHNILEAACFGKPLCFGQNYKKFQEAVYLTSFHGATAIASADDLRAFISDLSVEENYKEVSAVCLKYVNENAGASQVIFDYLKANAL